MKMGMAVLSPAIAAFLFPGVCRNVPSQRRLREGDRSFVVGKGLVGEKK
jgi:hypothetical protein